MNFKKKSTSWLSFDVYVTISFVCLLVQIFFSQYFRVPDLGKLFAGGGDWPDTVYGGMSSVSPIIGGHYFGDLLDGHVNYGFEGSYYGISAIVFSLTKSLSYRLIFLVFVIFAVVSCTLSLRRWLKIVANDQKKMVYALHFSYPFVFAADRGQVQLLVGYLFALGLSYVADAQSGEKVSARGQLALGIALSIKIYPILIFASLPNFWSLVKWKFLAGSILAGLLVITLFNLDKLLQFLNVGDPASLYFTPQYFIGVMPHNTSLKALIFNFQTINFFYFDSIFNFLFANYFLIYLLYAGIALSLAQNKEIRFNERLLVGVVISTSIAPIAAVYAQTLTAACALWSLIEQQNYSAFRSRLCTTVLLLSIIPLNFPLAPGNQGYLWYVQNTVVPFAQHAFVVVISCVALASFISSRRFPKPFRLAGTQNRRARLSK